MGSVLGMLVSKFNRVVGGSKLMLIPFHLQTIMLFLWERKYVNSFLFTNYHDLGLQGNNLGGPLLAWQHEYFSCWLLDRVLRLAVSEFLFSFIFFLPFDCFRFS